MSKVPPTLSAAYLIKQLPTATVFVDREFCIAYASDKWVTSYSQDEIDILGKNIFKLLPELSNKWEKVLENSFQGQASPMGIERVFANDQDEWHQWSTSAWYNDEEHNLGAIIECENITETIKGELKLAKIKSLLKQQSKISKIGNWEYNIIGNTLEWCPMTKNIHEVPSSYEPDIETSIKFYKEGHSRNAISMAIFEAMENGTPWNLKLQITTANGKEK